MVSASQLPPGVGYGAQTSHPHAYSAGNQMQQSTGNFNQFSASSSSQQQRNNINHINNNGMSGSIGSSLGLRGGDFLYESYGGLRFAKDLNEDEDDAAVAEPVEIVPWRMRERMKTMDVALVLCLNIGTDPPDIAKTTPCARKECWVDPFSMPAQKALETIGKTLQSQYERWQPRARYRPSLDPTVDEIKQLSVTLRRNAKHDRVLFHYNGHGVPRPTQNGEIWVFNKSYTQYIPLLVYDLQSWIGMPSIYVFDCSAAGILLSHFTNSTASASDSGETTPSGSNAAATASTPSSPQGEAIVLAACGADEILPMNPELCADVFTSCLTTPITVALRWFISQNEMSMSHLDASFIDRIPGKLTDRKTPLGELNWIFTAITDTIAWNVLPRELFQKLFRQDLLVASLFRNFLLAERIMKSEGCAPCSLPALPSTNHHPLWRSWDLAAEICLNQLYKISHPHPHAEISFQPSRFFAEQLTAFEVWLQFGAASKPPPQQLPMVLQVLLSQVHRLRALVLLKKFLDLGPWAVNLALSVGIFPYVLKLLQSPASELRQVLVFIWAKILALDPSCQVDLVKEDGHGYFISHLATGMQNGGAGGAAGGGGNPHGMPSEQKVMAAFILSVICGNFPQAQKGCLQQYLHRICANTLLDGSDDVRRWICLCLAKLWENCEDAKRVVIDDKLHKLVSLRLHDDRPEVRASAAYALGALVGLQFDGSLYGPQTDRAYVDEHLRQRAHSDIVIAAELLWGCQDASPFVRRESVLALANVVLHTYHQPRFELVAKSSKSSNRSSLSGSPDTSRMAGNVGSSVARVDKTPQQQQPQSHTTLRGREGPSVDKTFPIGEGVDVDSELVDTIGDDAVYYVHIWHVLKEMQAHDPFPRVVRSVKLIVSRVNAAILAADKVAAVAAARGQESSGASTCVVSGGDTSGNQATAATTLRSSGGMQREGSAPQLEAPSLPPQQQQQQPQPQQQQQHQQPNDPQARGVRLDGGRASVAHPAASTTTATSAAGVGMMRPTQSVGNLRAQYQDEGAASRASGRPVRPNGMVGRDPAGAGAIDPSSMQHAGGHWNAGQSVMTPSPVVPSSPPLPTHGRQPNFPQALMSKLYDRYRTHFNESILEPSNDNDDPLSEKGGEKLERVHRYDRIRKAALKIASGFSAPAPTATIVSSMGDRFYPRGMPPSSSSSSSTSSLSSGMSYSQGVASSRVGGGGDTYDASRFSMTLRQRAVLNNDAEMTSLLLFHPYEKMLIVADEKDQISLYNFERSEKKALSFGNKNPTGSRLTSLSWINETEESLLTCGSDDGVVRIYHGLHSPQPGAQCPKLVSSFEAVPDLIPGTRGSGLVTNWQQNGGILFAGGNSGVLRGWNMRHERCAFSMPTQTDSCITTLTSDETMSAGLVVAGFGDGTLRLFDARASRPEFTIKSVMSEHSSWVVQTHLYPGKNELLSGSVSGELKFWDLRYPKTSVRSLEAHRSPMTALAVHDYAPIFASGSHNQFIKVFRSDGEQLALIRYHEGFLGERIGPVSCLAFHPHRLFLAAGATDSVIAIYSAES